MKPADLPRRLNRLATRRGWEIETTEGVGHTRARLNGRGATIPRHTTDLKTGTFRGILRQLGLTADELEV